jgi:hypothetical protein
VKGVADADGVVSRGAIGLVEEFPQALVTDVVLASAVGVGQGKDSPRDVRP